MHEHAYHTKHWLAFYVKPRHEKKVAERLNRAGTELFCPMVSIRVRWSDRWKKIQKPLITGYIFARVTEMERREILNDPGIWRTVFWRGRPALIRDEEIEIMRLFLKKGDNVKLKPFRAGERVKVTDGGNMLGITGMEGVVIKVNGNQVSLRLESLQAQLSMTIPRGMLTNFESVNKK